MKRSKDRSEEFRPQARRGETELAAEASERLATIVNAAERAAEQVIDDAEARAGEILAAAERDAERLRGAALEAVERARRELEGLGGQPAAEPDGAPASRASHLSAVPLAPTDQPERPRPLREPVPPQPLEACGTPAGARLLATQMAVSGSSRKEIEARLRNGFDIEDPQAILDAILGPED